MTILALSRPVSALLIPCLLLSLVACYTFQEVPTEQLTDDEVIIVAMGDDACYRLSSWNTDRDGNITGSGYKSYSRADARDGIPQKSFTGTLSTRDVVHIEAERLHIQRTLLLIIASLPFAGFIALMIVMGAKN